MTVQSLTPTLIRPLQHKCFSFLSCCKQLNLGMVDQQVWQSRSLKGHPRSQTEMTTPFKPGEDADSFWKLNLKGTLRPFWVEKLRRTNVETIGMMRNEEYTSKILSYILRPSSIISSGIRLPGLEFWFGHLLALWSRINCITFP